MSTVKGWDCQKLSAQLALIRNGFSGQQVAQITDYPVSRIETISDGMIDMNKVGYVDSISDSYMLKAGDILFSNINSLKHIGKVAQVNEGTKLFHGMNLLVLRPVDEVDEKFLFYKLISEKSWFEKMAAQAINQASINQETLKELLLELPQNKPEQAKIAEVLSTVDIAIEQTEALIAKQQRIKTGLMQDLLTRGIDEHGNLRSEETHEFKDSPLGWIPVEWKHECFGNYIDVLSDYHSNGSYEKLRENVQLLSEPNYAVMIRTLNLENDNFEDLIYIDESAYRFLKNSSVEPGDVLMNKIANAGSVYLMPNLKRAVSLGMNLFLIRTHEQFLLQTYAYYYLNFHEAYVKSFSKGTTTKTITKNAVRNLVINIPSVKEQERIISLINRQDSVISSEIKKNKKLRSLKTALMQDLLTGKKRVTALLNYTRVSV